MDKTTAENIGKTARALKHWNKVLSEIDKKRFRLNQTQLHRFRA